jgi:hypothetical protein
MSSAMAGKHHIFTLAGREAADEARWVGGWMGVVGIFTSDGSI